MSEIKNRDKLFYLACPNDNCRRKVSQESNNMFRCESCARNFSNSAPTYMVVARVTDFTDSIYVNFPKDCGTAIMGKISN